MADNVLRTYIKYLFGLAVLRKVIPWLGSIAFVLYVGYIGWLSLGPQKPVPDFKRQKIAAEAVKKIVAELREHRGDIRSAAFFHFRNDPTDCVSDTLRTSIDGCGVLNIDAESFGERLQKVLNLRISGVGSVGEARKLVGNADVDGILIGQVENFESTSTGAILTGQWQLINRKTGEVVYTGIINENTTSPAEKEIEETKKKIDAAVKHFSIFEEFANAVPWYTRFLGFVLLTLLLPIITISFVRTMVAKQSNRINAFMLGTYTVIDGIFAFLMVGGALNSGMTVLFFLGALALAFFYNVYLMSFALKLEAR